MTERSWWALLSGMGLLSGVMGLGCGRGSFRAQGGIASVGGELGAWRSTAPLGCSRDPIDGLPVGESKSVVTLLWEDPAAHESDSVRDRDRFIRQDAPLRLELSRDGSRWVGNLILVRLKSGTRLDSDDCATLRLDAEEKPAVHAEGKPTLAGRLRMDCRVRESHVTADVQFERCSF